MPISGGPGLPGEAAENDPWWPAPTLPAVILWDDQPLVLRAPQDGTELLRGLARQQWTAFLPGLLRPRDARWLDARLADRDDPLDFLELAAAAQWVAAHVCRMSWWAAVRLAAAAREDWATLDGRAAMAGVDLAALPVDRALAAVWSSVSSGADQERMDQLQRDVFESSRSALELAAAVAPDTVTAAEIEWGQEAALAFGGGGELGVPSFM